MKTIQIAIDGHSSCGKSTLAKSLASHLGFLYIDTGAMYRALTLYALRNNIIADGGAPDEDLLRKHIYNIEVSFKRMPDGTMHTLLNNEDVEKTIRTVEISRNVSAISAVAFVREVMVDLQRKLSENSSVVMDGRDIGTVVFPNADLKIFVTASPEVRAQRRYKELIAKGDNVSYQEVYDSLVKRDKIDTTREASPLRMADDAVLVDNSEMTIEGQFQHVLNLVQSLPAYKQLNQ